MTKLSAAEFKELEKNTPNGNKLSKLERAYLFALCENNRVAYIYSGGKHLNVKSQPPNFNKIRFIVKPLRND